MLHDRILTREVLRRRGIVTDLHCINCENCPVESLVHLIFLCPYAIAVWFHIASLLGKSIFKIASSVKEV